MKIANITGYKFIPIKNELVLQETILQRSTNLNLKGTVLISRKGINFSVSGNKNNIDKFLLFIRSDSRFADVDVKITYNEYQPFRKMLVRIKKEIISMGIEEIDPFQFTGQKISPKELNKKLNNNEDIVLLDTRNEYEVRLGTFKNAIDLNLDSFRDFPKKIEKLRKKLNGKEVVMFCTGGIRCEKASALMLKNGFENIQQIDGGVINYFKETGGRHWNGDCFVFDDRVALDKDLLETDYVLCFRCREPLNKEEIGSEKYKIDEYCPYCFDDVFAKI
ncbi:rhodanese-like domain-containing protein [Candidatus Actinomarina sp.]|nr:rhodanese-like domain-containing protein [Candidatus Actinomarina sp.]MDA8710585.1 rhodanese-like domain-containing protein [Candidatus Actinomarina sp.]